MEPQVLMVEDSPSLARVYQEYLKDEDLTLHSVSSGREALDWIDKHPPALILLDLKLPDMSGMDILRAIHDQDLPIAVIIMTAHGSVDVAVDAMRFGAMDFLEKPFDARRLRITVRNVLEQHRLKHLVAEIQESSRPRYHGFIGASLPMQAVYRIIDAASPSKATVFITGESGTGKEVCAEAIHKQGPRAQRPFIALNCGAIPKDLMESEIFGHVKGAFTGALGDRKGAAEQADGGTLFLDEIGEMDMDLQTKLLRFVQTGRFNKVGGSREITVDVRFVCATNRDPLQLVQEGKFREDLYYRLHVVPIHLPPLRERGADILSIARQFLTDYATEEGKGFQRFSDEVEVMLSAYAWPGNVRQLQNVIRNMVVLHDGTEVEAAHVPPPLNQVLEQVGTVPQSQPVLSAPVISVPPVPAPAVVAPASPSAMPIRPLAEVERETIEAAIAHCNGNIPKAAALLEVSPSTIYRKKQAWEEAD